MVRAPCKSLKRPQEARVCKRGNQCAVAVLKELVHSILILRYLRVARSNNRIWRGLGEQRQYARESGPTAPVSTDTSEDIFDDSLRRDCRCRSAVDTN